jgi:hypothetical protein
MIAGMPNAGGPIEKVATGYKNELLPMLLHVWFCGLDPGYEDTLDTGPDGVRGRYICAGPNSQYTDRHP